MADKKDSIEKAVEELREEYERATKLDYVRDPIGWALYRVWDRRERRNQRLRGGCA